MRARSTLSCGYPADTKRLIAVIYKDYWMMLKIKKQPLPNNLQAQLAPFVGRQAELSELHQLLLDPNCRLLTLSGTTGMGKTRLA